MTESYTANDYSHLVGDTPFSEELMETHLKLYEGYVKHTNKAIEILRNEDDGYKRGEVRRRFAWEFNGMRLHELYFDAMTPGGTDHDGDKNFVEAIKKEFNDLSTWQKRFREVGSIRGIGWACLTYDPIGDRTFNTWINEHDAGALAGTHPLLLMDVFEHAFIRDFGTDRDAYMDAFFDTVDWNVVEKRFERGLDDRSDTP